MARLSGIGVVPFLFVLKAGGVVAQADSRFLVALLLGMTRGFAPRNDKGLLGMTKL